LTTKFNLLTDALGRPLRFLLTGRQAHERRTAEALLDGVEADAVLSAKGYVTNVIRQAIADAGMTAVIPSNGARKIIIPHDKRLHRERNRTERYFNKLKHFRRIASRFDRRAVHFSAFLCLAAAMLGMR
jgi:transposase